MPAYALINPDTPNQKKLIIPDEKVHQDFSVHMENFDLAAENYEVIAGNVDVADEEALKAEILGITEEAETVTETITALKKLMGELMTVEKRQPAPDDEAMGRTAWKGKARNILCTYPSKLLAKAQTIVKALDACLAILKAKSISDGVSEATKTKTEVTDFIAYLNKTMKEYKGGMGGMCGCC